MNPKISIIFLLVCSSIINTLAQTTIIFRPDSESGKDAIISCYEPDKNFGNHPDFFASAWTKSGNTLNVRSLIEFDLSIIAKKTKILTAKLSLYSHNSPSNGSHSTLGGSNTCYLQKITSEWDESMVTWNNQPTVSDKNMVTLSSSQNSIQHFTNIDITEMVQEMIDNPSANFGFMLKLEKEERYRKMMFASSDNSDADLHPELTITYQSSTDNEFEMEKSNISNGNNESELIMKSPNGMYWKGMLTNKGKLKFFRHRITNDIKKEKIEKDAVSIFINYPDNYLTVKLLNRNFKKVFCKIYDMEGKLIHQRKIKSHIKLVNISQIDPGEYLVKIYDHSGNIIDQRALFIK